MSRNVWVWVGLVWNSRVRDVLDHYGDRLTDVSIFGWKVDATGALTQTFDPTLLDTYRTKWPHIRWWGCFRNDGVASAFTALQTSATARATLVSELKDLIDAHPWMHGIDIDLERGGSNVSGAEAVFQAVADGVHAKGKQVSAALPPLTEGNVSIGGENWCRYGALGAMLDHVSIMTYDFAWAGSAPGPVAPFWWMQTVYDWATTQMPAAKISMGVPAYGRFWRLHDTPEAMGVTYRGASTATYYGASFWLDGTWVVDHPTDPNPQPHVGWVAFRDPETMAPWAWIHAYDVLDADDHTSITGWNEGSWQGRRYLTRFPDVTGDPIWTMADQTDTTSRADFLLNTQPLRLANGHWTYSDPDPAWTETWPKRGYNLTLEMLARPPESAAIFDDDFRTPDILASAYYARSGTWSQWPANNYDRAYSQARVTSGGGTLNAGHNFGSQALHVQARGQLPSAGSWGVHIGDIRAVITSGGTLTLRNGSTVLATTTVTAPGTSTVAGEARGVVGLRIRGTHARAYHGATESSVPLQLEADIPASALDGTAGVWSPGAVWIDHLRLGDGWWYQPQEAVTVELPTRGFSWTVGRIPRTGVTWDAAGRFRPNVDIEEWDTRGHDISLDWDYRHLRDFPIGRWDTTTLRIRPLDPGVWLGRMILGDAMGFGILHYSDADSIHWLTDRADDYGLAGVAIWTLGQEDPRLWERLAGGQLS